MGMEPPARAEYLRTIWSEYSRMHSHLLWLGLYADSMGYENVFMQAWRMREKILDVFDATTGGRVIQNSCKVGGVRRDVSPELLASMKKGLEDLSREFQMLDSVFGRDKTIQTRSRDVGILTKQDAAHLGAVGPVVRASGIELDTRQTGYAAYRDLDFEPVVLDSGDCYDRCMVRVGELFSSVSLIRQAINQIPDGETEVKVKGNPNGEFYARAEQPRGEVIHYIKAAGKKNLVRHRVRTPTMANLAPLVSMLKGCELADVPVIVLSIDPCIGCMER
jgi:Ni,Fe-hydrogenase III large subunit